MIRSLALFCIAAVLTGCAASWEETGGMHAAPTAPPSAPPVTPVPAPPPVAGSTPKPPAPIPTPTVCPHVDPGLKVITAKQCVDLVSALDKEGLKCIRAYLKKGYTAYPYKDTLLTIDETCKNFILHYNCPTCK